MSSKLQRIVVRGLVTILLIATLLSAFGIYTARRSFPKLDGEIILSGLEAEVNIYRDDKGIPNIYASSLHDLFFAQGYLHAQDRFWQMDFWRHIGAGRLSEMFGADQVETDAFLRTMGWMHIAEQEFAESSSEAVAILEAYSQGVNAYLSDHSGSAISLEYAILGLLIPDYKPEAWTPVNSLTWAKAMAWDLRGNIDEEIERALLMKTFSTQQLADLFPAYPSDHPVIVDSFSLPAVSTSAQRNATRISTDPQPIDQLSFASLVATSENLALLDAVLGPSGTGIGSNSWVLSGKKTSTGMPLLANDPHLGIQMPSIWYQVGLHCQPKNDACPYEVAGFSFAGVPGVIIGHNERIAWAFTNNGPDVMDLYMERVNPDNPNQYEVNGQWVDFELRSETILVGGEDGGGPGGAFHPPRAGDLGCIWTGGICPAGWDGPSRKIRHLLAWTALAPQHIFEAVWGFNKAQGWDDFRRLHAALLSRRRISFMLMLTVISVTRIPGLVPIRRSGDGTMPCTWLDRRV